MVFALISTQKIDLLMDCVENCLIYQQKFTANVTFLGKIRMYFWKFIFSMKGKNLPQIIYEKLREEGTVLPKAWIILHLSKKKRLRYLSFNVKFKKKIPGRLMPPIVLIEKYPLRTVHLGCIGYILIPFPPHHPKQKRNWVLKNKSNTKTTTLYQQFLAGRYLRQSERTRWLTSFHWRWVYQKRI